MASHVNVTYTAPGLEEVGNLGRSLQQVSLAGGKSIRDKSVELRKVYKDCETWQLSAPIIAGKFTLFFNPVQLTSKVGPNQNHEHISSKAGLLDFASGKTDRLAYWLRLNGAIVESHTLREEEMNEGMANSISLKAY